MNLFRKILTTAATMASIAVCTSLAHADAPVKLSSFGNGFNPSDSTYALEQALASGTKTLIIDKQSGPWITSKTLVVPSNIELIFEKDAEIKAKKGCFLGTRDSLLSLENVENIVIRGEGDGKRGVLRMNKADYTKAPYEAAEWRHTILIHTAQNVLIQDMNTYDSGGDGLCMGISTSGITNSDIVVRRVTFDNHHRQGLSIGAAVNCLFEDVDFTNTSGTAPQAGVDFEPDINTEPLTNLVFRRCNSSGNKGCGYQLYLPNQDEESGPMGITFEECTANGNTGTALSISCVNGGKFNRPGYLIFRKCNFHDNPGNIVLDSTNADGFATIFDNVTFTNVGNGTVPPLQIGFFQGSTGTAGNIHFVNNTTVTTSSGSATAPYAFNPGGIIGGFQNVSGSIRFSKDGGTNYTEHPLTTVPRNNVEILPLLDISTMSFQALTPDAAVTGNYQNAMAQSGIGRWQILGKKNTFLSLTVLHQQLTAPAEGETIANARVTLKTPDGTVTLLGEIPLLESRQFSQKLTQDGLYTLTVTATGQLGIVQACSHPVQLHLNGFNGTSLTNPSGTTYFYVPKGTEKFALQFLCDNQTKVTATLYDHTNAQVFTQTNISKAAQYNWNWNAAANGIYPGGVFRLVLTPRSDGKKNSVGVYMTLCNIPPLLALAQEQLITEQK